VIYQAGSPRSIILMHECTSVAAVGAATAAGAMPRESVDATLFLRSHELLKFRKTRDDAAQPGDFFPNGFGRRRDAFQEELYADAAIAEQGIRAAWNREQVDQAVKIATRGALSSCAGLTDFLDDMLGHDTPPSRYTTHPAKDQTKNP